MTSYVFQNMKRARHVYPTQPVGQWQSSATGAIPPFRMLLIGGGGSANGLATTGAEDCATFADLVALSGIDLFQYEFNGSGYTQGGIVIKSQDRANSSVTAHAANLQGTFLGGNNPTLGFGTLLGTTITDLVGYFAAASGVVSQGIPLWRVDLAATYVPQGATMTFTWAGSDELVGIS